jgi:predicted RNA binding protein YcfA (HicA-like mRNA interferase family)
MHNYPILTGNRLIRALTKKGYIIVKNKKGKRGKGGHIFIRHPFDPVRSAVVQNISDDLEIGVLNAIRKQLKLSKEEFIDILKEC